MVTDQWEQIDKIKYTYDISVWISRAKKNSLWTSPFVHNTDEICQWSFYFQYLDYVIDLLHFIDFVIEAFIMIIVKQPPNGQRDHSIG